MTVTPMQHDQASENLNVTGFQPLATPRSMKRELPNTPEARQTVQESRQAIKNILDGHDSRLLIIIGPCSIHDETQALEYAGRLLDLRRRYADRLEIIMRVYPDKPRTTVGWRGYLNDPDMNGQNDFNLGLHKTRELMLSINSLGLPLGTELLDPFVPQYIDDQLSWGAIGARTTESQTHRAMVSGVSAPVGFKNGTGGSVKLAVDAILSARKPHTFLGITDDGQAAVVSTRGNAYGHIILRGGTSGPNYGYEHVQAASEMLTKAGVAPALIVDCSHHNSGYLHEKQLDAWHDVVFQRVGGDTRLKGLMVESNLNAGKQGIPTDLSELKYGVSVTDACVGWDTTEQMLAWAYERLA
ncbi:3-deoxy-7-phosphoheptulonate synthase [Deinococcus sp.]|uniref:3-deoxy-7-phosphoheptulonate synthase n=1 Tax=Deinococcus sp. TaxID=47478 RepID=UPI003C7A64C8